MLAAMEQWDMDTGCHIDKTAMYLLLMILKLVLDASVFYLCCQKLYTFFLNMCSLSLVLFDLLLVIFMATVWILGTEKSLVSPCFVLANASAAYGALPLPMMFLGFLDYCLQDASPCNQRPFCKLVGNAILTLLVWILAITYTFGHVQSERVELDNVKVVLVCIVDMSTVIKYFVSGLFMAVICMMLPFCSMIPRWVNEADTISEAREEEEKKRSDLFTLTNCIEEKNCEKNYLEDTNWPRPPLWFSLTLGFGLFWLPYLAVSVACMCFGMEIPGYLSVNILWLECANSLLLGLVFWAKSKMQGPYSQLPENVCSWNVFWHLSKGQQWQPNSMAVFIPLKKKKNTLLCV
ncbi:probable G-protein coupled receptor 160 [Labrus mixtus]|uniref:probable G-protein coupled receptor 160 n=1 Tax=Labrus mixtus TaxID=508554 RepID=UPI0029C03868|nr:probable G-protein coupled receptor 160 [Labrus mixtus]XP_060913374.1 probable G-protein coupled receptor 160 [Labrus mixtus]XP_060913375.1 probable G-protein coupled receptor 160 [Labrus mixtus]